MAEIQGSIDEITDKMIFVSKTVKERASNWPFVIDPIRILFKLINDKYPDGKYVVTPDDDGRVLFHVEYKCLNTAFGKLEKLLSRIAFQNNYFALIMDKTKRYVLNTCLNLPTFDDSSDDLKTCKRAMNKLQHINTRPTKTWHKSGKIVNIWEINMKDETSTVYDDEMKELPHECSMDNLTKKLNEMGLYHHDMKHDDVTDPELMNIGVLYVFLFSIYCVFE